MKIWGFQGICSCSFTWMRSRNLQVSNKMVLLEERVKKEHPKTGHHTKNKNGINESGDAHLRLCRLITVLITNAVFNEDPKSIPEDCMLICKENYIDYFGPFSSRIILSVRNENLNYA